MQSNVENSLEFCFYILICCVSSFSFRTVDELMYSNDNAEMNMSGRKISFNSVLSGSTTTTTKNTIENKLFQIGEIRTKQSAR